MRPAASSSSHPPTLLISASAPIHCRPLLTAALSAVVSETSVFVLSRWARQEDSVGWLASLPPSLRHPEGWGVGQRPLPLPHCGKRQETAEAAGSERWW
jgi:hypothetical protein